MNKLTIAIMFAIAGIASVQAQTYPSRSVTLIVPTVRRPRARQAGYRLLESEPVDV